MSSLSSPAQAPLRSPGSARPSFKTEPTKQDSPKLSRSNPRKAVALMVMAVGLFAIMDAVVKWMGQSYSTTQIVFFRSLFAFLPLSFFIFRAGIGAALRVNDAKTHVLRSAVGLVAMFTFFYAYANMPLADAIAISFAAPIFVTALSVPLLGEKVGPRRWAAVLAGFVGVLIMVQPGPGLLQSVAIVPLIGVVFYALAAIYVRKLSHTDSPTSIVFYFTLACTVVSGVLLPFSWVTPSLADLMCLIAVGLIGGLAQITITQAFRHADVALVMPFEYTGMIWAAVLGFMFWGEIPGLNIWIGVAIVVAAGLYILFREANLGLPRGAARKLQPRR